jgi:hypothetical protein
MSTIIVIYFSSIIFLGFLTIILYIFFHIKYTNDIIELLKEKGFLELSNKISQLISTGGKMPFKGSLEAVPLGKAWNEFIKIKISNDSGKLYKLQYFYRILRLTIIINGILFSIPFIILIIIIVNYFIKKYL